MPTPPELQEELIPVLSPAGEHHKKHIEQHTTLSELFEEFARLFPESNLHQTSMIEFHNWSLNQFYEPDHEHNLSDEEVEQEGGDRG